jgi:hypothetical protein
MPGSTLAQNDCEIRIFSKDLVELGEFRNIIQWKHTLRLNDIGSWQIDLEYLDLLNLEIFDESCHVMFLREGVPIIDGPVAPGGIQLSLTSGAYAASVIGACDNIFLTGRICYPVVSGAIFDSVSKTWKFSVLRSAVGINSAITTGDPGQQEYDIPLVVTNAESFIEGNQVNFLTSSGERISNWNDANLTGYDPSNGMARTRFGSSAITIAAVDLATNTVTIAVPQCPGAGCAPEGGQLLGPPILAGWRVIQTTGGIVEDPSYVGYDTRVGAADVIASELVYYNAGPGACGDAYGSRSVPYLMVGTPAAQGTQVTSNARGEELLTQVQNICLSGGVNFRTRMKDPYKQEITFETFMGKDLSQDENIEFSLDAETLKEFKYAYGPPAANMVWCAGPNTGPDKIMLPSGAPDSISQYGRWEQWVSNATAQAGDTAAAIQASMVQANNLQLASSTPTMQLSLTLQESDLVRYGRDFDIADKVRVIIGDEVIPWFVSAIDYTLPSTGSEAGAGSPILAAMLYRDTKQMTQLREVKTVLQQIYLV